MKSTPEPCFRPKIAIIHPAFGKTVGGSQIFVMELTKHLQKYCEITILCGEKVNEMCKPIKAVTRRSSSSNFWYKMFFGVIKRFSKSPDIAIEHISSYVPVFKELMQNDYDLIFPNNDWGGLFAASTVRWFKNTPILFTEHCGYMEKGKIAKRNLGFNPDKYITLSQELKYWVKKYYPEQNVEYIPNGIDLSRFNPEIPAAEVNLPKPIYCVAGRNAPNKRLKLVIEAVSLLSGGSLLILCPDENTEELNKTCERYLNKNRYKIIKADYENMASLYKACDVFTLPSIEEPFGLAYLEAMACNKPVVSVNDTPRKELIGSAGILCDVCDSEEYAKALYAASKHDFGDRPFLQAQKYSWERTADEYIRTIMEMANKKTSCNCSSGCKK